MSNSTAKKLLLLPDAFVVIPDEAVYGPYPYESLQIFGFAIIVFFIVLSTVAIGLRIYSRLLAKGFGPDDWLIFVAFALAVPQAVTTAFVLKSAYWGIHDADIPGNVPANLGAFWLFLNGTFYSLDLALIKISALLFLLRLGSQKTNVRIACWAIITFNALQAVTFLSLTLVQCLPIQSLWVTTIQDKLHSPKCIRRDIYAIFQSSVNIVTDALTVLIPFLLFLNLKVNKRVRNALLGVFLLGTLVTIISGVRLYYILRLYYLNPEDKKYSIGYVNSTVEINLAIVTASVPALWPLARRWFPGVFESLGIDRPYLQPDIEVGYLTKSGESSSASGTGTRTGSRQLRGKVLWRDVRHARLPSGVRNSAHVHVHAHGGAGIGSIGSHKRGSSVEVDQDYDDDNDDYEIFGMPPHHPRPGQRTGPGNGGVWFDSRNER